VLGAATAAGTGLLRADRRGAAPFGFSPGVLLRPAGDPAPAARLAALLREYLGPTADHPGHPSFPGAVAMAAVDGVVHGPVAVGYAVRYADASTELPAREWVPTTTDTVYDLASLTKLFTTVLALRLAEAGALDLDAPVQRYLPGFTGPGKAAVTSRLLLRHRSGLPADVDLVHRPGAPASTPTRYLLAAALANQPGRTYRYSDAGMAILGLAVAAIGGTGLERLLAEQVTGVLALPDTAYRPLGAGGSGDVTRIAATEAQPWVGRPMLRGEVHDEMAYALGGVSGHAGLFGTARDLLVFGQALLNGGGYGPARLLRPATVAAALTPGPASPYGLGFELNQPTFMGALAGPASFGHTGFTGTSLVVDLARRTVLVLLSNRVHPTRGWGAINPTRRRLANEVAAWSARA
jgi:CubicO group peptidase (beta-lactamase class C family)